MASRPLVPTDIASCVAWWDAGQGVTQSGGLVTQWLDQKTGLAATATTDIAPTFSASYRNGKPRLVFPGGKWLNFTPPNSFPQGSSPGAIFVSAFTNDVPDEMGLFSYGQGDTLKWRAMGKANGGSQLAVGLYSSDQGTSVVIRAVDRLISWISNGTANAVNADTDTQSFTLSSPNTVLAQGAIGRYNFGAQQTFQGDIDQVVLLAAAPSATEQAQLEGWASWWSGKNGANLPANHPYKAAAPTVTTGGTSYALAAAAGAIVLTGRSAARSLKRSTSPAVYTLTGRTASQAVRRAASPSVFAITGRSAAQAHSRSATPASYALTGGQTSTARARTLLAGVGLFALTGGAARQAQGRSASPGTFTVTGQPIAQGHIFTLACNGGSIAVTGQAAARSLGRFGSAAAFTVAGTASAKAVGRQASGSTRTVTGGAASRGLGRFSTSASFAVTGLSAARALSLAAPSTAPGTVTGRPTSFASGRFASPGAFVLNGVAAGLRSLRGLAAGPGTFGMTGFASGYTNSHVSGYTLGAGTGQYGVRMFGDGSAKQLPFMKRKRVRFGLSP
jgi:hypothetical protein